MGRSGDPRKRHTDPRRAGGSFVNAGTSQERHSAVIDPTDAVLLEDLNVVMIEPHRAGVPGPPAVALELAGRINHTEEHSRVLYLTNEDGAAALVTEILALYSRMGVAAFDQLQAEINRRMDALREGGHLGGNL